MTRDRWVIVGLFLAALLWNTLAGRAEFSRASVMRAGTYIVVPYKFYRAPHKERVRVQIMWVASEAAAAPLCGGGAGCWFPSATGHDDLIVAVKPKDFNDERALLVLGHEVLHALGGQHD